MVTRMLAIFFCLLSLAGAATFLKKTMRYGSDLEDLMAAFMVWLACFLVAAVLLRISNSEITAKIVAALTLLVASATAGVIVLEVLDFLHSDAVMAKVLFLLATAVSGLGLWDASDW